MIWDRIATILGKMVLYYFAIGLLCGSIAWLLDANSGLDELVAIPVIATVWPLCCTYY